MAMMGKDVRLARLVNPKSNKMMAITVDLSLIHIQMCIRDRDKGINYIVMELVEGITLKDYISKKGKLTVKEATSIAIQVSMGLEAAHNRNIVHRDIKPQNIIISTDGKVKVTDFGIARVASSNTISTNAMGSVHYSSPEQVRGGYSDFKSDIYSLGITMYEMVTGRVPLDVYKRQLLY